MQNNNSESSDVNSSQASLTNVPQANYESADIMINSLIMSRN